MKRKELAQHLGVSYSLLRKYETVFAAWLTTPPGELRSGVAKVYTEEDVRTLSTIQHLRAEGVSYEDMKEGALDKALTSGTISFEPQATEGQQEREEPQSSALVPVEKYAIVVGELQATERELARVLDERDKAQEALVEAEKKASAAQATEDERDRLLEERDKANATTEELRKQLEDERTKNWWQKLRGQ